MRQAKENASPAKRAVPSDPTVVLIYGQSKIGLTSLAAQFPGVLVLNVNDDVRHLGVNEIRINTWDDFLQAGADLNGGGKYAQPGWICVAHVSALWDLAADYSVQAFNKTNGTSARSLSEASYTAYKEALRTFEGKLAKLSRLGSLLLLEHEQVDGRNFFGLERTFVQPALEKHVLQRVANLANSIGRVFMAESGARMVSFQPAPHQLTGSREPELLERQYVILPNETPEFVGLLSNPHSIAISA